MGRGYNAVQVTTDSGRICCHRWPRSVTVSTPTGAPVSVIIVEPMPNGDGRTRYVYDGVTSIDFLTLDLHPKRDAAPPPSMYDPAIEGTLYPSWWQTLLRKPKGTR